LLYLNQFSRENFVRYGNPFQETISRIFEILNLLFRSIATQPPAFKKILDTFIKIYQS
jgi:hypothetical protein